MGQSLTNKECFTGLQFSSSFFPLSFYLDFTPLYIYTRGAENVFTLNISTIHIKISPKFHNMLVLHKFCITVGMEIFVIYKQGQIQVSGHKSHRPLESSKFSKIAYFSSWAKKIPHKKHIFFHPQPRKFPGNNLFLLKKWLIIEVVLPWKSIEEKT